jgi:pimeloyl-ACP methyl ester carboxylesterase
VVFDTGTSSMRPQLNGKDRPMLPTIVLVHGAFAESATWDRVIDRLMRAGHPVIAAPNPLRGLSADAAAVSDVIHTVEGSVVLCAHSYGGAVISNVDAAAGDIVGLVYANGFAPDAGETCFSLAGMFPGSMLGEKTLRPVPHSDGTTDLFIKQDCFHELFCPDVPAQQAVGMGPRSDPPPRRRWSSPRVQARCGRNCLHGS